MSCGAPAAHIVIYPYKEGDVSGRLLVYCDSCAQRPGAIVVLPERLLDEDPNATLEFLYGHRLTHTNPEVIRELLHVPASSWTVTAERTIRQSESP